MVATDNLVQFLEGVLQVSMSKGTIREVGL